MHLWPSSRLRDSFKLGYLKNLEWNLHRMNSEKKQSQSDTNQSKLLDSSDNGDSDSKQGFGVGWGAVFLCREFLMVTSCCYYCFCCGACVDDEEH